LSSLRSAHDSLCFPELSPSFARITPVEDLRAEDNLKSLDIRWEVEPSKEIVEFFPVVRKGDNYLKYCIGWLSDREKPDSITQCFKRYTTEKGWFCSKINTTLASDSPTLEEHGQYIKQLKYCIGISKMNFSGTVFRGNYTNSSHFFPVDASILFIGQGMTTDEVAEYEKKQIFFIPSFTSTSKTEAKAFHKNVLIHIEIPHEWSKFCAEITSEFTSYPEEEILLSCYNLYQYCRTEKSNGKRILKLQLLNYETHFNFHTNTIIY
jgi:hypothetical protein